MSTTSTTNMVEAPSTRVMGLGIGIFVIGFFSIVLIIIFLISTPCSVRPKIFCRALSTISLGVIILLLIFAPRESAFVSTQPEVKVTYYVCFILNL